MKNIDELLEKCSKNDVNIPSKIKYKVQYTLKNKTRNKAVVYMKKFATILASLIIVCIGGISVYAGVTGNFHLGKIGLFKLNENYDKNAVEINQSIENEYFKITLESMAGDSSYIVAKYIINFTDKALNELEKIEYDQINGYNLGFTKEIFINSEKATKVMEYVDKLSDIEYTYIQIIDVTDLNKNKLNLEINLETLFIGNNFNTRNNFIDTNANTKINEVEIGKKIKSEVTINNKRQSEFSAIEQALDNNTRFIIEKIANTNFDTYIKVTKITENLTMEEYNNKNPFQYNSFMITQDNDEILPYCVYYGDTKIYTKINNKVQIADINEIKNSDIVRVEENFTIRLGLEDDLQEIRITPTQTTIYNDRTNEEKEMYDKVTWYPIIEGDSKYSANSGMGGVFEIENIKIDEDNITFYYNEKGIIGNESLVIIRKNNGIMNYIYATSEEKKGIDSNENKIVFARKESQRAGCAGWGMSWDELDNIDDITQFEFALLYGSTTEIIGKSTELNIPIQDKESAKINNLKIE